MPTYRPLHAKVQLCVASLADTTLAAPERRKAAFATREAAKAEENITKGKALKETPISCCGEDSRLHFLGASREVPFFMMRAGADLFRPSHQNQVTECTQASVQESKTRRTAAAARNGSRVSVSSLPTLSEPPEDPKSPIDEGKQREQLQHTRGQLSELSTRSSSLRKLSAAREKQAGTDQKASNESTITSNPFVKSSLTNPLMTTPNSAGCNLIPQAIGLLITTSKSTYIQAFDEKHTAQDVKIDVFYNGEFSECLTIPARWSNDATSTNMIQLVSGKRVDRLIERPWVIVPPQQNANGSLRSSSHSKVGRGGPKARWRQIGDAILREAQAQGLNQHGDTTPSGSYLASLAELEMPTALEDIQKAGGPCFGVIDVVISVGRGIKGGPNTYYLTEPMRMVDDSFKECDTGVAKSNPILSTDLLVESPSNSVPSASVLDQPFVSIEESPENAEVVAHLVNDFSFPQIRKEVTDPGLPIGTDKISDLRTADLLYSEGTEVADMKLRSGNLDCQVRLPSDDSQITEVITQTPADHLLSSSSTHNSEVHADTEYKRSRSPKAEIFVTSPVTPFPSYSFPSFENVSISPERIETLRQQRSSPFPSEASGNIFSSPEDGRHSRGFMRIPRPELCNTSNGTCSQFTRPSGATYMPPPQTPLSALGKRRQSDAILFPQDEVSPKRRRNSLRGSRVATERPSSRKTVEGELGMSRRGIITRRPLIVASPLSKELRAESGDMDAFHQASPLQRAVNQSKKASLIRRILITANNTIVVDRICSMPMPLSLIPDADRIKAFESLSSPIHPLDEFIVFGLRNPSKVSEQPLFEPQRLNPTPAHLSAPPFQPPTPQPSSSPIRRNPTRDLNTQSPSRRPKAERAGPRAPKVRVRRSESGRVIVPTTYAEELDEKWKIPDLCKDSVLSYAEDGPWLTGSGRGGTHRHIKSARPGWFKESEVLFAVRYIVG